jgi:hypothetical protein
MKSTSCLALSVTLMFTLFNGRTAHAQFGFKGGLNISRFAGPGTIAGASSLTAGNFGIVNKNRVNPFVSIQEELLVSWEGEKFNNAIAYGSLNFTYLNLPVLARLDVAGGLFAETGPQFGLQLSAKLTYTNPLPYQITSTTDYSSQTVTFNFGWIFGLGYQLTKWGGFDARYDLGITSLANRDLHAEAYRSSVISIGLFAFPFWHRP